MWSVEFESEVAKSEVQKMMERGELTKDDERIIGMWIRQVTFYGPKSVRRNNSWSDHELHHEWSGYRSSAFSNRGRIIYRIKENLVKILVARITVTHDYGKK